MYDHILGDRSKLGRCFDSNLSITLNGGIAVLAGLVCVGVQLLGANREARAATLQMLLDTELARYAEIWNKVIQSLPIDDDVEIRRAVLLYNLVMTSTENR